MIRFYGELSKENKKIFVIKIKILLFLCFLLPSFLMIIPFIILVFTNSLIYLLPILLFIFIPIVFLIIKNKYYEDMLPNEVIIKDNIIISIGVKFKYVKEILNISKVVDYGDCYKIFFKFPHKNQSFICQKDLIVEGSIKDFEKLFAGKIKKVKR